VYTIAGPVIYGGRVSGNAANDGVVTWSGSDWQLIGVPDQPISLFVSFDDGGGPALHVFGRFTTMNGQPMRGAAKWDGSQWHPLGAGITTWKTPRDAVVHDDGSGPALYISDVLAAGGQPVARIAKWDGQAWSSVGGGGIVTSGITEVYTLGSFDDGRGPALYIAGMISIAGGGVQVRGMARYDGQTWDDLGGGSQGGFPYDFVPFDDGRGPSLFAVGYFNTVGAGALQGARGVAQLVGCQSQCYADCDNSGSTSPRLNVDDFTCFINRYAIGDPYVDCNADGLRNIADFHCFLARFAEGCQ
jgi:trimeric autotransporter adhesin